MPIGKFKTIRVTFMVSEREKTMLDWAAKYEGSNVSEFLRLALRERAERARDRFYGNSARTPLLRRARPSQEGQE